MDIYMLRTVFTICFLGLTVEYALVAQQIVLQVVDGRKDKPISNAKLYVSFPTEANRKVLQLSTNSNGTVAFDADGVSEFQIHPVALVTCGEQRRGEQPKNYSVNEVMNIGVTTTNDCGRSGREPLRGKLVIFVRPAN